MCTTVSTGLCPPNVLKPLFLGAFSLCSDQVLMWIYHMGYTDACMLCHSGKSMFTLPNYCIWVSIETRSGHVHFVQVKDPLYKLIWLDRNYPVCLPSKIIFFI